MGEITEKGQGATELWRGRIVGFTGANILLKPESLTQRAQRPQSQEFRGEVALSGGTENCMFGFRIFFTADHAELRGWGGGIYNRRLRA
jgi:energy-converting hydrogenase Eha subunit G